LQDNLYPNIEAKKKQTVKSAKATMVNEQLPKNKEQEHLRYRVSCLLYDFIAKKTQLLKHFNLPSYEIPWLSSGD
jgi:hypothetical protein